MKNLIWTFILSFFFVQIGIACDCGFKNLEDLQKQEIENSECIFIGEIIEVNNDLTYKIKVVESLDGGDLQENIYIGKNWKSCQPYVEGKGTWLVYGGMENGFLKMNICGLSRAFDKPVAPPSKSENGIIESTKQMTEEELYAQFWKEQRIDLANEIAVLRRRRDGKLKKASR
ncbi:hypothetical protein FVB32_05155 [Flagellimonas hymeniacidonis]|uniref:Tissue inhibitor of metalloproteinase n=1 Tax=Flagellimonas hymeniacidonis TaxID=2603628 RepID=A0A5C8V7N3_9FLAO|nr:hypothetical protein [Flagellimonas hymeniacidonis]TXN37677.1 hypothetical protein FVB32_05155 [Flagellimonas hymeniacidonis]